MNVLAVTTLVYCKETVIVIRSSTNVLAVGLSDAIYTWNAETGNIDLLMEAPEERENGYPRYE